MPKQSAPTDTSSNLRRSERERTATSRFLESWFGISLPRLSLALGLGTSRGHETEKTGAECEVPSNGDDELGTTVFQAEDECPAPLVVEEMQEDAVVCGSELRRSERERKATRRFEEGWFGVKLPSLSAALGLSVADGKGS